MRPACCATHHELAKPLKVDGAASRGELALHAHPDHLPQLRWCWIMAEAAHDRRELLGADLTVAILVEQLERLVEVVTLLRGDGRHPNALAKSETRWLFPPAVLKREREISYLAVLE